MSNRTAGKKRSPNLCAKCGREISGSRPVYLVATEKGKIVGPYDASCAEELAIAKIRRPDMGDPPGRAYGSLPPSLRKGGLPQ